MKKFKAILIVVILVFFSTILLNIIPTKGAKPSATLEDLIWPGREGNYTKYAFWLAQYKNYDNLFCVRKGGAMKETRADLKNLIDDLISKGYTASYALHRLTCRVVIDGNEAKFYATQGHRDVVNDKIERGTLLHTSNCPENNLMAAILTEGKRLGK